MKKNWVNVKKAGWIIVFGLLILFWAFQMERKEDMHCDEYFSYAGANSDFGEDGFIFEDLKDGEWITSAYFTEEYGVEKDEIFNYSATWNNQKLDVHPPLYYIILHFACSFFPEQFSMIPGLLVNLICMVLLVAVVYKTLYILSGNQKMSLAAAAAYGTCTAVTSTIALIRMYALAALFAGVMMYLYVAFIHGRIKNSIFLTGIFFVNLLGGLTHYYFLILSFIAFFIYSLWLIDQIVKRNQKIQGVVSYILVNAISAIAYLLMWPSSIEHIFHGYRGEEAFQSAAQLDNFLENIGVMFRYLDNGLWLNNGKIVLILSCVTAIGLYLNGYWNRSLGCVVGLGIGVTVYFLVVAQICPFKADRYLMPIYPLIAVIEFAFLIIFLNHFVRGAKVFFILIGLFVFAQILHKPDHLYELNEEKVRQVTSQEAENGLYINQGKVWYQIASNSLYLMNLDNLKVVFDMTNPDLLRMDERLQNLSSVCVFFNSDYSEEKMIEYFGQQLWEGHYVYTYLGSADYFNIYLFKKDEQF